ncbi:MAG: radical SAM protein [Candidatus Omnitrophota bacterium]
MRIVFVQSEFESLAIGTFSSLLKKIGHECFLVYDQRLFDSMEIQNKFLFRIFDIRERLIEEIACLNPDLVAFSVLTDQYQWALDMARRVKKKINVPVIFGGVHVTMVPDEVISNDCVDMICIGEGEGAITDLADSMQHSVIDYGIKNLWFKKDGKIIKNEVRPLIANLDSLPFSDKLLFREKLYNNGEHYSIASGRGCPFSCTYCASEVINRLSSKGERYVRRRSPEHVINELILAKTQARSGLKSINFLDDTFTYNTNWLKEFCRLYKEKVNVPFHCTGYPSTIDYERTSLLKDAGCYRLGIGIQSVSERIRKDILNRPGTNDQIRRAAKACKDVGLSFWFDHILNIPHETEEEQIQALRFYNEVRPPIINIFWLIYYPQTRIITIAKEAGILDDATIARINKGQVSTAMVIGIGGEYSFAKERVFANFAFLFHLLPLLPKKWMDRIIEKRMFMGEKFSPPILVNVLVKSLVRFKLGQSMDAFWFLGVLIKSMFRNLNIKLYGSNLKALRKITGLDPTICKI